MGEDEQTDDTGPGHAGYARTEDADNYSYSAIARLADEVSPESALNELNTIQAGIATEYFTSDSQALNLEAGLVPMQEWVTGSSRAELLLLFAAVGAAFLVACLNIANLMLVRATARTREAGIRSALSATRLAIFRSLFLESSLLAAAGTAGGIAFAWLALRSLSRLSASGLPRLAEIQMDGLTLTAAVALAIVATLTFGLLPAIRIETAQSRLTS